MEKLDRLGWAAGFAIRAYGVRVGIRMNDPSVLERLEAHLPPAWKPASSPRVDILYSLVVGGSGARPGVRRFNLLYANATRLVRSLDLNEVFDPLESYLHLHIAEASSQRVFVHAGVVGWHGQAIIIPGRSHSGKSTLVAAMVRAGAAYYSDEYAVLDGRGRVHPYAKPLSLREGEGRKPARYTAEALGGSTGGKPLPVGLVVVSEYKSGTTWRPRHLSAGRGVLALLANTVSARRQPVTALATLQRVAACARVIKGERGEASEIAPSLLRYLEN
ncbi:MAG: hypothetical protein ACRERE_21135 [Candidatus Entotheonellia bacterium]